MIIIYHLADGVSFVDTGKPYAQKKASYTSMELPPKYPVPALPIKAGYLPSSHTQVWPCACWFVCHDKLLWAFFDKLGMAEEKWE